jgi:hypothetical protein
MGLDYSPASVVAIDFTISAIRLRTQAFRCCNMFAPIPAFHAAPLGLLFARHSKRLHYRHG